MTDCLIPDDLENGSYVVIHHGADMELVKCKDTADGIAELSPTVERPRDS